MLMRTLAIAILLYAALMTEARAWTLNTWVKSAGGNLQSPNLAGSQTSVNGSVTKSYSTTSPLTLTVTPNPGFRISNLTKNGLIQTLADSTAVYTTTAVGPPNQSVWATFARISYTLSASAGANGTVSPASINSVYFGAQSPVKVFTFTPASGYNVQGINVSGHVLNTDYQLFNATTNALITLPAAPNVRVKVAFANVKGPAVLTGMFTVVGANAGPGQTVLAGSAVTLDGSASTGANSYVWTQLSGPATVVLTGANSSQATFTAPASFGYYVFRLTVNGTSSSTTSVFVSDSVAQAARSQCVNCHNTQGVGPGVYANWSSSGHKSRAVVCYTCHAGANTGGHPGIIASGSVDGKTFNYTGSGVNFCTTCHSPAIVTDFAASGHLTAAGATSCSFCHVQGVHNPNAACVNCHTPGNSFGLPWPPTGLGFHNDYTGSDLCTNCHNLHNPNVVTGMPYPHFSTYSTAQYVTTNIACGNCHNSAVDNTFNVYPSNREWAKAGHANPVSPAFIGQGPYTEANLEAADYKFLGTPLPAKPATTVAQDCVRCHTTTGYINYVTPLDTITDPDRLTSFSNIQAWGTPGDRTREMVACPACHTPTPFSSTFSRRTVGLVDVADTGLNVVQAWYNYSSAATRKIIRTKLMIDSISFSELGASNICITCHSGTASGNLIKQTNLTGTACTTALQNTPSIVCQLGTGTLVQTLTSGLTHAFWSNADFIDPHGLGSANIMYPDNLRAGYEYRVNSSITPAHADINSGIDTSAQGACVGCHMTSPKKHVFAPVSSATNGTITAITTTICSNCHGGSGPGVEFTGAGDLETRRVGYQAALTVITAQLAARGVYFNATKPPYFFTTANPALQGSSTRVTDWNTTAPGNQGAHLMGAAFNLRLHQSDAGWVHNPSTSKRLLFDSIDYLDNGVLDPVNGGTVSTTINTLPGLDSNTRTNAIGYLVPRL